MLSKYLTKLNKVNIHATTFKRNINLQKLNATNIAKEPNCKVMFKTTKHISPHDATGCPPPTTSVLLFAF